MKEFIEKLIGRLEELGWVFADYYPDETAVHRETKKSVAYDDVVKIVNQLAEEYNNDFCEWKKENSNGWISVSERLPEIDGNTSDTVLVCAIDGYRHMAFWCDDGKWRYCESGEIKEPMEWTEIVAWQPLPEPFKPKGEQVWQKNIYVILVKNQQTIYISFLCQLGI